MKTLASHLFNHHDHLIQKIEPQKIKEDDYTFEVAPDAIYNLI